MYDIRGPVIIIKKLTKSYVRSMSTNLSYDIYLIIVPVDLKRRDNSSVNVSSYLDADVRTFAFFN